MQFLVIGGTGHVGGSVIDQLLEQEHTVRALVRDATRGELLPAGVDIALGDLDDTDSLAAAARGVDGVFFLQVAPVPAQAENMVHALRAAGVRRLVVLSSLGTALEPKPLIGAAIADRDAVFEKADLDITFLRANAFMTNALGWVSSIREEGRVYDATDPGRTVPVDPSDIARVVVVSLTEDGHVGATYLVNGPEALSAREQVTTLAEVIGRPIEFVPLTPAELADRSIASGTHPDMARAVQDLDEMFRTGRAGVIALDVANLTGTAPRNFRQWCQANAGAFQ